MKPKKRQPGQVRPDQAQWMVEWSTAHVREWYRSKSTAVRRMTRLRAAGKKAYVYALSDGDESWPFDPDEFEKFLTSMIASDEPETNPANN